MTKIKWKSPKQPPNDFVDVLVTVFFSNLFDEMTEEEVPTIKLGENDCLSTLRAYRDNGEWLIGVGLPLEDKTVICWTEMPLPYPSKEFRDD
jgi:hypothetical protein